MLVLFETPAGYALFKLLKDKTVSDAESVHKHFDTPKAAAKAVKLEAFSKFENTADALSGMTSLVEGKVSKNLKKFLGSEIVDKKLPDMLAVGDNKLGASIAKKLGIKVVSDAAVNELMRGIRSQLETLITGLGATDMKNMVLGLSHSLSRYKLKFSPDKVDTMIVQAIHLLDDLDKELNTYAMRAKEWYGWHFPELTMIIVDNLAYAKLVKTMGIRQNAPTADLDAILPEDLVEEVKRAAQISMGTDISEEDIANITYLCDQIISITEYRTQLYDYLKNRMAAIAPNLTTLVGELVGARLIAHAGSLMNLAKHPASTVQILGAEKALFRALKTKHDTPKYGLIYHASLVGQASPKMKGKIARVLSTKAALSIRVDALGDKDMPDVGSSNRDKVERRLRQLEGKSTHAAIKDAAKSKPNQTSHQMQPIKNYSTKADVEDIEPEKSRKRKAEDRLVEESLPKKKDVESTENKKKKESSKTKDKDSSKAKGKESSKGKDKESSEKKKSKDSSKKRSAEQDTVEKKKKK